MSVTDCGANASSSSPSNVTIDFTRLVLREGSAITLSPLRIRPEATVPQKPRKSRFGRLTNCTGKRKSIRLRSRGDVDVLQMMHQRRALVPRHLLALLDEVVALERRQRNEVLVDHVEPRGELAVVAA